MSLVTAEQQTRIAEAIAEVERHTDAELVTVIAAASDDYRYIPLLWAALAALIVPALLYFTPLYEIDPLYLFWAQAGVFVVLALALSLSAFRVRLIPRAVREWRASNMACRQFLEQGLHHTEGETGVLIFVSEAEHFVEILVDRGISAPGGGRRLARDRRGFHRRSSCRPRGSGPHPRHRTLRRDSGAHGAQDRRQHKRTRQQVDSDRL